MQVLNLQAGDVITTNSDKSIYLHDVTIPACLSSHASSTKMHHLSVGCLGSQAAIDSTIYSSFERNAVAFNKQRTTGDNYDLADGEFRHLVEQRNSSFVIGFTGLLTGTNSGPR